MVAAVQLCQLQKVHAEATLRWLQDPSVAGGIGLRREPNEDRTGEFINRAENDSTIEAFAIVEGGRHLGNVFLDQIDRHIDAARFYIYVGEPDARGRGVGRSATLLALDHAFGPLALNKVWLTVHARNRAAIRAYETCGFRREGALREEFLLDGERIDALRMGILVGEHAAA